MSCLSKEKFRLKLPRLDIFNGIYSLTILLEFKILFCYYFYASSNRLTSFCFFINFQKNKFFTHFLEKFFFFTIFSLVILLVDDYSIYLILFFVKILILMKIKKKSKA